MTHVQQSSELDEGAGCDASVDLEFSQKLSERALTRSNVGGPQQSTLARIIETEVIPRLLVAHQQPQFTSPLASVVTDPNMSERIGEFADLVINRDGALARSYFEAMLADGASIESLFRELIGPTARRLGKLWEEDINSMLDVTQGLAHLQQLVRAFAPGFTGEESRPLSHRRALIMPLPGEQHTLGVSLIEEYFRREGWHVCGGPSRSIEDINALVSTMWFDMVGFSVSRVPEPEKVALDIRLIREAARNRNLPVMIGGVAFVAQPELAAIVGADATATDGQQALLQIAEMIGRPSL